MIVDDIERFLPHRKPMLLLDSASLDDGVARGKMHVKGDEWFLQGHFPDDPVVPGVILCEALAQTTAFLIADGVPETKTPFLVGLDQVRLKRPVKPGQTFETECRVERIKEPFYFTDCKGYVAGKICVKARLSFALIDKAK
ncbi:MAG: 3-hydroxyacyl-ACP dehydratase FabZ family protein [Planctomycetia bacterium]|nr:3-hydroxyacyl-ACP dehydratase FabZ family protein [Planctomycetia bacterium]